MSANHTPTPWTCCEHDDPVWRFGPNAEKLNIVGLTSQKNDKANAEFIVRACNSFEALVSALKWAQARIFVHEGNSDVYDAATDALTKAGGAA